jgi:hypothetical protein
LKSEISNLTFSHDGTTNVRVLFDATATLTQAYTFVAYGDLIAIHNAVGTQVANSESLPLTRLAFTKKLGDGEYFDSDILLRFLRGRWQSGHRFFSIDPFQGDRFNPLSFNKHLFVHGDPIHGIDPTGMFLGSIGSFLVSSAISIGWRGATVAGVSGVVASATYGFYFNDNPAKGFFYGAELGLALSTAYSFGGAKQIGETIAKAAISGLSKVAVMYVANLSNPVAPPPTVYQQAFFEAFANSAWSQQFGWFLKEEYKDMDDFSEAAAYFTFSFGTSFLAGLPDVKDNWSHKTWRQVLNDTGELVFKSLETATLSFVLSPVFDKALKDIPEPVRTGVKGVLGLSYGYFFKSLREILDIRN